MRGVNLIKADQLANNWPTCSQKKILKDGKTMCGWFLARPLAFVGINNIKLAWGVLVGKYDALKWEGQ